MADTSNLSRYLKDVASAIKEKTGKTDKIPAANFDTEIRSIETGIDTSDATATNMDLPIGVTAYARGEKITGVLNKYENTEIMEPYGMYVNQSSTIEIKSTPHVGNPSLYGEGTVISIAVPKEENGLVAENIIKGANIFGVEGTAETGGSETGVKLFGTIDEMRADTKAKEGDIAIVYRNELQPITVDSHFSKAVFPETVVLPSTMTDYVELEFRAVDDSVMLDCMGQLDSYYFRMNCHTETGNVSIEYESSDGITYNRISLEGNGVDGNNVDFGIELYYANPDMWHDTIGYFIQSGGAYFDGFYSFNNIYAPDIVLLNDRYYRLPLEIATGKLLFKDNEIPYMLTQEPNQYLDGSIVQIISTVQDDVYDNVLKVTAMNLYYAKNVYGYTVSTRDTGVNYACLCDYNGNPRYSSYLTVINYTENDGIVRTDFDNSETIRSAYSDYVATEDNNATVYINFGVLNDNVYIQHIGNASSNIYSTPTYGGTIDTKTGLGSTVATYSVYDYKILEWIINPTQFTITPDSILPGKTGYGSNGIIEGDGSITTANNTLNDTAAIMWATIQKQYDDMEIKVLTDSNKTIDSSIYIVPAKSNGNSLIDTSNVTNMSQLFSGFKNLIMIQQLDTSKATNMSYMFNGCSSLIEIPQLDTSNVTNMYMAFNECSSLTTIPLLNTNKVTDMSSMFRSCTNLTTIPKLDMSSARNMSSMFNGCSSLSEIPQLDMPNVTDMSSTFSNCTSLTEIPQFNMPKVVNMSYTFNKCSNLTTIPQLNTSKVTTMAFCFSNCPNLSDDSLNNILGMCSSTTNYKKTKTLKNIGLSSEQAIKCTTLSNYQSFLNAGWTTGY